MARAVEACVHCGFCLPTCPTYLTMGQEMDSPRGRIILMKEVLEGNLPLDRAGTYIDHCLGCMACVTACPSGVPYGDLISPFRAFTERKRKRGFMRRLFRRVLMESIPHPGRFRLLLRLGVLSKGMAWLTPKVFRPAFNLLPRRIPRAETLPEVFPAEGARRARVALLAGCAQQVLAPEINLATLRVLSRNGVETVIPRDQACCGALAMHVGESAEARSTARKNIAAFSGEFDAIITNAAGCGSGMKEYPLLFEGQADDKEARRLSERVVDVSVFLDRLGFKPPPALGKPVRLAYHDACHLAHAQGVRSEPRRLLASVEGLSLVEPAEWEVCCGSAGTYNLEEPETADQLGKRKASNILATGAQAIATGNIGCLMQIRAHITADGRSVPVYHTMEVLDAAYGSKTL